MVKGVSLISAIIVAVNLWIAFTDTGWAVFMWLIG